MSYAAVSIALQLALPFLREAPHCIGSLRSRSLWRVHLFVLCRANPKASICLVSPTHGPDRACINPAVLAEQASSDLDLRVVPMRFHPDSHSGLDLRPSSNSELGQPLQQWLGESDSFSMIPPQQIVGIEVMRVRRKSDGLEFLVASSESAAEVIAGELIRAVPLWRSLASRSPSLREVLLEHIL